MIDPVRVLHRVGLAVGVVVLLAGLGLLFAPGTAESVPLDFTVVQATALGSILLGIWVARRRYNGSQNQTVVPDVELPLSTPAPGDDIDEAIYRLTRLREGTIEHRKQIQTRLGEVAVSVIMQRQDCSRAAALEQLEEGTWTEDPLAANLFRNVPTGESSSVLDELLTRFRDTEHPYERQLRATVAAIEEIGEFEFAETAHDEESPAQGGMTPNAILGTDVGERISETTRYVQTIRTHHWTGITAFGLVALAVGIVTAQPPLILASALGIGVAGYARVTSPPALTPLTVTRTVSDTNPRPGETIDVTVTVENTGDVLLPDLTLVDRLPPTMHVVDGDARMGTALRSGGSATFRYTAVVERGHHTWPLQVVGRDAAGELEREALIDVDTTVECVPRLRTTADMPVRLQTSVYAGGVNTEVGGEGLEFFSVRDYQPGDPKRRIDWKTYARTGEFSTVDFREEHAARVVLLFDRRASSYVSPRPGETHAVDRLVEVSYDVFSSLYDQGHLIGIAAFNGIPCWLGPSTGSKHLRQVRDLFVEHPALSPLPPTASDVEEGRYVDPMVHIRRQLPGDTQIFLFSPLTDEYTYEVARRLNGAGHLVTVLSTDPTTDRTVGQRIARLERAMYVKRLRDHGIRVVDWRYDRPLNVELEHAKRRWNA